MRKYAAFTLVEAIIVIIITGVLAQMISVMMTNGFNIYLSEKRILDANWQGRLALERMANDFRSIRSQSDITTITASQFSFTNNSQATITYQLSGSSLMRSGQVLADGITGLTFSYFDRNGNVTAIPATVRFVRVACTVTQNNTQITLTTALNGRDLG